MKISDSPICIKLEGYDMSLLDITIYSHHYTVCVTEQRAMFLLNRFRQKYQLPVFGKKGKIESFTCFTAVTKSNTEYRFHINTLAAFKFFLEENRINETQVFILIAQSPTGVPALLKVKDGWVPKDYQIPYIEYMSQNGEPISRLAGLQTGKGKTFIALYSIAKMQVRTLIFILPKYIDKWIDDCNKVLDISPDRILVIRKGSELRHVLELGRVGELDVDIIIISNRIYKNYIKEYELVDGRVDEFSYPVLPEQFHESLGVGNTIVDEVHQEFRTLFIYMLYSHTRLILALSATLHTLDKGLISMYGLAFPYKDRHTDNSYDKYINVVAIEMEYEHPNILKYKDTRSGAYNHIVYEQSVMRNREAFRDYLKLISDTVELGYIKRKRNKDTCLVFVASIKLATIVTNHLVKLYPNLDVRRYVEDDPYENIMEADIKISTILSAGTALDIPNLITVVQTVNIQSYQANIQSVGRLRKIEGIDTIFYYIWCNQIPKHEQYHEARINMLKTKVKNHTHVKYPKRLGITKKY